MIEWLGPADIDTYHRTKARLQRTKTVGWTDEAKSHLNAMIRDCDYILEWLETGRRPGNKRGVERLAAYQREIPMEIMERYAAPSGPLILQTDANETYEYQKMEFILSMLTERERECYEMQVGGLHTEREIASILGLKRATVQEFIRRAKTKIKKYKVQPMPLLLDIVV